MEDKIRKPEFLVSTLSLMSSFGGMVYLYRRMTELEDKVEMISTHLSTIIKVVSESRGDLEHGKLSSSLVKEVKQLQEKNNHLISEMNTRIENLERKSKTVVKEKKSVRFEEEPVPKEEKKKPAEVPIVKKTIPQEVDDLLNFVPDLPVSPQKEPEKEPEPSVAKRPNKRRPVNHDADFEDALSRLENGEEI